MAMSHYAFSTRAPCVAPSSRFSAPVLSRSAHSLPQPSAVPPPQIRALREASASSASCPLEFPRNPRLSSSSLVTPVSVYCSRHVDTRIGLVSSATYGASRNRRSAVTVASAASPGGFSGDHDSSPDASVERTARGLGDAGGHVAADVVRAAETAVLQWWATAASWVKWPAATFLLLFALVNIIFGAAVAADLAPLWLLGPLLLSASLRLSHSLHQLTLTILHRTAPQRQLLLARGADVAGYLRSGNVSDDARKLLAEVREEVEGKGRSAVSVVQDRQAALVVYVNSGRMAEDVQSKAERWAVERWEELCDWTILRAEDASDWLRVNRRRLGKVLEKVF